MGICFFYLRQHQSHCLKVITTRHILPHPLCLVQRELVFPVTLRHSAAMRPAVLASPPWGPPALFFSGEAALCSAHLFDTFASFKSQLKSTLLTMPYRKAALFVPMMHQVSGHLAIHEGVCGSAHCLLSLPGYLRKEGRGSTCLLSRIHPLEHYRCFMQPQSSDAKEDLLQFRC